MAIFLVINVAKLKKQFNFNYLIFCPFKTSRLSISEKLASKLDLFFKVSIVFTGA